MIIGLSDPKEFCFSGAVCDTKYLESDVAQNYVATYMQYVTGHSLGKAYTIYARIYDRLVFSIMLRILLY